MVGGRLCCCLWVKSIAIENLWLRCMGKLRFLRYCWNQSSCKRKTKHYVILGTSKNKQTIRNHAFFINSLTIKLLKASYRRTYISSSRGSLNSSLGKVCRWLYCAYLQCCCISDGNRSKLTDSRAFRLQAQFLQETQQQLHRQKENFEVDPYLTHLQCF